MYISPPLPILASAVTALGSDKHPLNSPTRHLQEKFLALEQQTSSAKITELQQNILFNLLPLVLLIALNAFAICLPYFAMYTIHCSYFDVLN